MRLFVDNLSNIDFSYLHPSRGLVGETWLANVELRGALDDQGMVCDFSVVKRMIRQWLDEQVDHRLLVPTEANELEMNTSGAHMELHWHCGDDVIICGGPCQAFSLIAGRIISPETVSAWCVEQLGKQFPKSVVELRLRFDPENIQGPFYHYSHGLKKHDGNCQRIAHGHRSSILIWRNGQLDLDSMSTWAAKWRDIYIGTHEDCVTAAKPGNQGFRYQAQQGEFYLELPKAQTYLIDTDSTVEFIAQHIAQELKLQAPQDTIKVKAFEGLAKGAIVEL